MGWYHEHTTAHQLDCKNLEFPPSSKPFESHHLMVFTMSSQSLTSEYAVPRQTLHGRLNRIRTLEDPKVG